MFKIFRNAPTNPPGLNGTTLGWDSPGAVNNVPIFFAHVNNTPWWVRGSCCFPVTLPAQSVFLHPGAMKAVLRFLVPPKPGGGSYQTATITGTITHLDYNDGGFGGGDGIAWSIEHNFVVVPGATGSLHSTSPTNLASSPLSFTFPVTTGDRINFVVDAIADINFDLTGLSGKIDLN